MPAGGLPRPDRVRKDGFHGSKQRYECASCSKKFMPTGQALHWQFTAKEIAAAIDGYFSGMSYQEVAEHIDDFYHTPEPSKHTIHDWMKGYTGMVHDFLLGKVGRDGREETAMGRPIRPTVGDMWVCDETYIQTGGDWRYCGDVMNADSRYILAVHYSPRRGNARQLP